MEVELTLVAEIFKLNTDLLLNCLSGVSQASAAKRVLPDTNSMAFLVAHVVDARYFALTLLGLKLSNPLSDALGHVNRIEQVERLPGLDELQGFWVQVSKHLDDCLKAVSAEFLKTVASRKFPVHNVSVLGALTFLAQHESYHIGQLAFIRKGLGYPAMAYTRSTGMDS